MNLNEKTAHTQIFQPDKPLGELPGCSRRREGHRPSLPERALRPHAVIVTDAASRH